MNAAKKEKSTLKAHTKRKYRIRTAKGKTQNQKYRKRRSVCREKKQ